jgi:hypothetical protein
MSDADLWIVAYYLLGLFLLASAVGVILNRLVRSLF